MSGHERTKMAKRPPRSRLVTWQSSFDHPKSSHQNVIDQHYFNHKVDIFVPYNTEEEKERIKGLCATDFGVDLKHDFYYIVQLDNLTTLFTNPEFINQYIRNGIFYATSVCSPCDTHNSVAVLPTGTLIMEVDKDTYERLGIQGKQSFEKGVRKPPQRHRITIDLLAKSFRKGKSNYDRFHKNIKEKTGPLLLLIAAFDKGTKKALEIDFAKYGPIIASASSASASAEEPAGTVTGAGAGIMFEKLPLEKLTHTFAKAICIPNLIIPNNSYNDNDDEEQEFDYEAKRGEDTMMKEYLKDVYTWLGFVSCGIKDYILDQPGGGGGGGKAVPADIRDKELYVSQFDFEFRTSSSSSSSLPRHQGLEPYAYQKCAGAFHVAYTGFIAPHRVAQFVECLRNIYSQPTTTTTEAAHAANMWCSIQVTGIEDSIVSWKTQEHGYLVSGENDYTFCILPKSKSSSSSSSSSTTPTTSSRTSNDQQQQQKYLLFIALGQMDQHA